MDRAGWLLLLILTPVGALAGTEDGGEPSQQQPDGDRPRLDAQPTRIPYRSIVAGVPVPGARRPPQPPPRVFAGPNWLQRTLNIPDPPKEEPRGDVPSSAVPEAQITARNLPPEPPRPEALSDDEIVVWGDRLEQARAKVVNRMHDLGYEASRDRNGRTVWTPVAADDSWKPRVIVDDDGWFELRTPTTSGYKAQIQNAAIQPGPVSQSAPGFDSTPPVPTMGVGGQFAGKRVRMAAEARVTRQIWDVIGELAEAQQDTALIARLEALPDELDALWYEGRGPDGTWYPTPRSRQKALLTLWATRTRTRSGETVRARVADFLIAIVDAESGLPADLVSQAERTCGCPLFPSDPSVTSGAFTE